MKKFLLLSTLCLLGTLPMGCGSNSSNVSAPAQQNSAQESKPAGNEMKSEAGKFAVTSPVALKEKKQMTNTPIGQVETNVFLGEYDKKGVFAVMYVDYPEKLMKESDAQKVIKSAIDGAVNNVKGKIVSTTPITVSGHQGQEVLADIKGDNGEAGIVKSRFFLVKNRLYQVMTLGSKAQLKTSEIDGFLNSFKLTEEKKAAAK